MTTCADLEDQTPPPPPGRIQITSIYLKLPKISFELPGKPKTLPPPPRKKFLDPCMNYQQHSAKRSFKIPQSMKINLPL